MYEHTPNNKEAVAKLIKKIHLEYEKWYESIGKICYRIWYSLQLIILLSGFSTSIFVAFQETDKLSIKAKVICIILPLLGSLSAAIILQFKIFETWKLREEGRIQFQNLVNFGNSQLLKCKEEKDYQNLYDDLTVKANDIENDQATRYFALYGNSFITSFKKDNKIPS